MNYTDYLQKAGIKQKKIKGWYEAGKKLRKVVPSEVKFNSGDLRKRVISAII